MNIVKEALDKLGMRADHKGYAYCVYAIIYIIRYGISVKIIEVYKYVGDIKCVSSYNVERDIRYAIEYTWQNGNIDEIYRVFGYTVNRDKGKPTNREFLFLVADIIKTKIS